MKHGVYVIACLGIGNALAMQIAHPSCFNMLDGAKHRALTREVNKTV